MFEPHASSPGPSGLSDWPRPFVFRTSHLDGERLQSGQQFAFDMHLFDRSLQAETDLVPAFRALAAEGLGRRRVKVELVSVDQLNRKKQPTNTIYADGRVKGPKAEPGFQVDLTAPIQQATQLKVLFKTPTELKTGNQLATKPDFDILACRARDRISTLRRLYGPGPLDIDFGDFGVRAKQVQMTSCNIRNIERTRRSSRTGQVHSLGGFIGEAQYSGAITEFLPYLETAQWTGVGRQTVWGKGELELLLSTDSNE